MQEIITVTKIGRGNSYYEVASTARQNGTAGSLAAFTQELEALQFARRHHQQHQGSPYNAVLQLTEEQCQVLEQGKPASGKVASIEPASGQSASGVDAIENDEEVS